MKKYIMGILINPKGRSPSGHSVLEKQHLSNKMIVFQDALIIIIILSLSFNHLHAKKKITAPFKVGEYLEYEVKLFNKTIAIQKVWVKGIVTMKGKKCYHIKADIETVKWVSMIYHLHDVFDEYIEIDTLLPIRIKAKKKEGSWTNTVITDIDHKNKIAHIKMTRKNRKYTKKYNGELVGIVSVLFYARTFTPKKNEKYTIGIAIDHKIKYLTVVAKDINATIYLKKLNKKFRTYLYQQVGGKNVALWITNDKNRLPVKLRSVELKFAGYVITSI